MSVGKSSTSLTYRYLIKIGDDFKTITLNKKGVVGIFDLKKNQEELIEFVKKEKLSYRKEKDIVKIVEFISDNSTKFI